MDAAPGRRLVVGNVVTVDGRYADDAHDMASFFEHQHPAYRGADTFDHSTTGAAAGLRGAAVRPPLGLGPSVSARRP